MSPRHLAMLMESLWVAWQWASLLLPGKPAAVSPLAFPTSTVACWPRPESETVSSQNSDKALAPPSLVLRSASWTAPGSRRRPARGAPPRRRSTSCTALSSPSRSLLLPRYSRFLQRARRVEGSTENPETYLRQHCGCWSQDPHGLRLSPRLDIRRPKDTAAPPSLFHAVPDCLGASLKQPRQVLTSGHEDATMIVGPDGSREGNRKPKGE